MEELKAGREALKKLWNDGLSGSPLLVRHTDIIDGCIGTIFARFNRAGKGISVIATGGYGRKELFPFSDIDLLFLHNWRAGRKLVEEVVSAILYPLWDSGLEVGHSVRTLSQCLADCKNDFHLQASLLDCRLVAGSKEMRDKLAVSYRKKFVDGRRNDFYEKITASRRERHVRFGGHNFQLEPDIKEGRGGFRDIQSMQWTSKVLFGINSVGAMEDSGLINHEERTRLETSTEALIKIRNRLHYLSGRKNDQLFYEHQEAIAKALDFKDSPGQMAVEAFMQQLYKDLQNIKVITDLFFEHTSERIARRRPAVKNRKLDSGLEIVDDTLRLTGADWIDEKPSLLISLFSRAIELKLPIHYRSRQMVSENLSMIDESFRNSKKNAKQFFKILTHPEPIETLSTMLETGLLSSYITEFGGIESLALHDVYHIYTVDRHLLQTVSEVHRLREEMPDRFSTLSSERVLFLAALLHDIGKGSGRDHASRGSEIARDIGRRLSLDQSETDNLVFLIKNHLFMSHTAQRRDLEDPNLIGQFAEHVGSIERLDMLYLLSIADSKATGPASWSDWKGALLQELYLKTANVMESNTAAPPDYDQAADWMREQLLTIIKPSEEIDVGNLPDEYLVDFTPEEIKTHFAMRSQLADRQIVSTQHDCGDHWSLLIVSTDKPGLLAKICGTLALNNLNVLAANITTLPDGTAIDQLEVRPDFNIDFNEQDWQKLEEELAKAVDNRLGLSHRLAGRRNNLGAAKTSRHKARVVTDNHASEQYTIVEIFAEDQPALLYNITRTLADFELNISRAMISTRLEQLVDVFYLQDRHRNKITDLGRINELREALLHEIS